MLHQLDALKLQPLNLQDAILPRAGRSDSELLESFDCAVKTTQDLWRSLERGGQACCAVALQREAFLAGRRLINSLWNLHEVERISASARDAVQSNLIRTSLLLLAVAVETPSTEDNLVTGANGKKRNQHGIREHEAFDLFRHCRQLAKDATSVKEMPVGITADNYAKKVRRKFVKIYRRASSELRSPTLTVESLENIFSRLAELTTDLLDDCSRFATNEFPTVSRRARIARRRDSDNHATNHLEYFDCIVNRRRAFAIDASKAFKQLIRIERTLRKLRETGAEQL